VMMGVNSIFAPIRTLRFSVAGLALIVGLGTQPA
jgi:hypothetical protein